MTFLERTCGRCGTSVSRYATICPVCGADPSVGALVIRRSSVPALPLRPLARPLVASAVAVAAGMGFRIARQLLPQLRLRRRKAGPPAAVADVSKPENGRIVAIQRRFWAMGDGTGTRQWGAEETIWQVPADPE